MQIIADLEVHSKYSRAVSPKMELPEIARAASQKGIPLVGTGDWQHPVWFKEIISQLKEVSPGIFELKERPFDQLHDVQFLLSTEISCIYTQGGRQRRIHNLIFSPSMQTCNKIIQELQKRGANLMSDGRPIVGLSSRDLLELVLTIDERVLFIPAHVWTPWYGYYGSMSGFDSIEEGFGDMAKYIYAMETGLSSDPLMNWQIKELEHRSIVSFSDAHSSPKLGREATVFVSNDNQTFDSELTYGDIADAIKQKESGRLKIGYTIEFFPEEGKYHWSGHRTCGVRMSPEEVKEKGKSCPVCGRPMTIGVENRVNDLSTKVIPKDDLLYVQNNAGLTFIYDKDKKRKPFVSAVPLLELLQELYNGSVAKASQKYTELMQWATEFDILLRKPYEEIGLHAGSEIMEVIKLLRERKITVEPGYDGVFGTVKFPIKHEEIKKTEAKKPEENQPTLF